MVCRIIYTACDISRTNRHLNLQLLHQPSIWCRCCYLHCISLPHSQTCQAHTGQFEGEIATNEYQRCRPYLCCGHLLFARATMKRRRKIVKFRRCGRDANRVRRPCHRLYCKRIFPRCKNASTTCYLERPYNCPRLCILLLVSLNQNSQTDQAAKLDRRC